jgi:hypothetical protein
METATSGTEETWSDWDGGNQNMAIGAVAASAIVAALIAFFLRRRQQEEAHSIRGLSSRAAEAAMAAVGDDRLSYGRDLLTDKVLPEFKPALLSLLDELEDAVGRGFRQAEKAIKDL